MHHLRGSGLRSTFGLAPPYGVIYTADCKWRSVNISLDGMVLTLSRGIMSNVIFGTVFRHDIFEITGKISATMPLEQIV